MKLVQAADKFGVGIRSISLFDYSKSVWVKEQDSDSEKSGPPKGYRRVHLAGYGDAVVQDRLSYPRWQIQWTNRSEAASLNFS